MFFPALAIFTLSSCVQTTTSDLSSQKTVLLHTLEIDNDGKARANLDGKPLFTGNAVETFEQSPTKSVSSWKSGKRHGVTTSYFFNGNIRQITNYVDGFKEGSSKQFRISGELLTEENYLKDELHGKKVEMLPNGEKVMELHVFKIAK